MSELFLVRLEIEGLYPEGVISKLKREKIPLFNVQKTGKKILQLCIERKYYKKVFTILQGSCYNIVKVQKFGLLRALAFFKRRIVFFLGAALFAALCACSNFFVLRIEVVGTGNYYRREVLSLLAQNGVGIGKTYSTEKTASLTAQILAFENVSFCSLKKSGSVLRVEVQTSPATSLCERGALYSPAGGRIYVLTVVRGTAQVKEGDEVTKGQLLVGSGQENGREKGEIVMASVQILCRYSVETAVGGEEDAVADGLLQIAEVGGEVLNRIVTPTDGGCLVEIEYLVSESLNL